MTDTLPVFIGADPREEVALDVCRFSLLRRASIPLYVRALRLPGLRHANLYWRQSTTQGGRRIDTIDKRPFSTEFAFSRFLVPALCGYEGWALFCDCDFLFLADVAELVKRADPAYAVMVCKQTHEPTEASKMDDQPQSRYRRKNWSSLMLFNCGHLANRKLTVHAVNTEPGSWLHGLEWLYDEEIGRLPPQWNWISGVTEGEPRAVHYTSGGPWMPKHTEVAWANEWRDEYARACAKAMGKEAA